MQERNSCEKKTGEKDSPKNKKCETKRQNPVATREWLEYVLVFVSYQRQCQ